MKAVAVFFTLLTSTSAAFVQSWYSGQLQVTSPGTVCNTDYNGQPGVNVHLNSDGNLAIFRTPDPATIMWNSGATSPNCGSGGCTLYFQGDGNLVVYAPGFVPLWNSGTAGTGARLACMDEDPYLMIFRDDGWLIWSPPSNNAAYFSPAYTIPGCPYLETEPWLCI